MGGFPLCHRFRRPAGARQGTVGKPGREPNQAHGQHETCGELSKENSCPARSRQTRRRQTRRVKFDQTVKRTTRPYSFAIVKTVNALLFFWLAPIAATQAQAPPALSATNDNASAATNATATNIATAATNAADTNLSTTATNDLAARRRAFQQSLTNRLSRMGTNL